MVFRYRRKWLPIRKGYDIQPTFWNLITESRKWLPIRKGYDYGQISVLYSQLVVANGFRFGRVTTIFASFPVRDFKPNRRKWLPIRKGYDFSSVDGPDPEAKSGCKWLPIRKGYDLKGKGKRGRIINSCKWLPIRKGYDENTISAS